eukprot:TRINITY_DN10403_c0_g1_i1.p1 TRINITY_DN10403_c0_g1~~TRINITY_DN10403_c0_g1_i1.p1  ORF type:complete len:435 (-),score=134.30 TRINITY_DN10403_c0_g1_i1:18-1298(-)
MIPLKKRLRDQRDDSSEDEVPISDTQHEMMIYNQDERRGRGSHWDDNDRSRNSGRSDRDSWSNRNKEQEYIDEDSDNEDVDINGFDDPDPNEITITDLKRVVVKRDDLEKWLGSPFWNDAIRGIFVRIGAGINNEAREYKIAEVVGDKTTSSKYILSSGKECNTDLMLKFFNPELVERSCSIKFVSNSNISEAEFRKWRAEIKQEKKAYLPSKTTVRRLEKQIQDAHNYRWTQEDVRAAIEQEKSKGKVANLTKEKIQLEQSLQWASTKEHRETILEQLSKIKEIEEKSVHETQSERLAKVSQRNKELNMQRKKKMLEKKRRSSNSEPFIRQSTNSDLSWFNEKKRKHEEIADPNETQVVKKKKARLSLAPKEMDHDFEMNVDISLLDGDRKPKPRSRNPIGPFENTNQYRKLVPIGEYLRQNGFF